MYLNKFLSVHSGTQFDPTEGTGGEFVKEKKNGAGFCAQTDDGWVALYPDVEKDAVIVQIDGTKWNLSDPDTEVSYYHDYDAVRTHFEIRDGDNHFETSYDAWWRDVHHFEPNKAAASDEPENSEHDIFAYIREVREDAEQRENLRTLWSEELPE